MYQVRELLFIFTAIFIVQLIPLVIFNFFTKRSLLKNIRWILVAAYVAVIISLTILPTMRIPATVSWSEVPYNLKPFASILGSLDHFYYMVPLRNILGNIILLLPLAVFLKVRGWKKVIICGFLISLTIETSQLVMTKMAWILPRSFDVDDLILNTLGFWIGYLLRIGVVWLSQKLKIND